ncbi:MAG: magnesium transporter [Planctomycetes bacterium]|nr:magnesium transporter [Planctomycetota bacterium]MBL7009464.1 magnesium transporter [Planctomycetota bacterium]
MLLALRDHLELPAGTPFLPSDRAHVADIADVLWLDFQPEEARHLFQGFGMDLAAEVLEEAEPRFAAKLLQDVDPSFLGQLLNLLPADDGADLLEELPESLGQLALRHVDAEDASDLRHLGAYDPDSAGGLMTTEFIEVKAGENVGDVLKRIKRGEGEEAETIDTLYITGAQGELEGVISVRELLEANIHDLIGDLANPDVIHARVDEDREETVHRLLHYNLSTIPVLDPRGLMVGIITADDALEVLEEEGSEDVLLLAGASGASEASESLWKKVIHRGPMLLVTVLAGLAMSRAMNFFAPDAELGGGAGGETWLTVLSFFPMVLALSGTIGSQTSAVLVRGFAVGQITAGRRLSVFFGEFQVGVALGTLCCTIAVPAAAFFTGNWQIGIALGVSLLLAMTWAATAASSIAMGSQAAGLDPALVSGPVMMAVSDLSAVLLFFGAAHILLP